MTQLQFFIGLLVVAPIALFYIIKFRSRQHAEDSVKHDMQSYSREVVANDKLIIVEAIDQKDVEKIIKDFLRSYSKQSMPVTCRLTTLTENNFAVTFPYDISFELYCYLINYIYYPEGFNRSFKAVGWATIMHVDAWIAKQAAGRKVMLFASETDDEYDNVCIVTLENIGYKISFASGKLSLLNTLLEDYRQQPMELNELDVRRHIDINWSKLSA